MALHAPHPRQRRRAQALLEHHWGQSLTQLATFYAVRYATVHAWVKAWRDDGLVGVAQGLRSGRPPKVPAPAKKKWPPGWERLPSSCASCCRG